MNAVADKYAEQDVGSYFLYTMEAHPGENVGAIRSMAQKVAHAQKLQSQYGVTRPIYLDALTGECHRAYGTMPNMTWIFNRSGTPIYKSDWSDAASVANAIDYFLDVTRRRRNREKLAPFRVERLDYRPHDRAEFDAGLLAAGQRAYDEFVAAEQEGTVAFD